MDDQYADYQARLMKALGFTADDLAANREGRLSPRFIEQYKREGSWRSLLPPLLVFTVVVLFLPIGICYNDWGKPLSSGSLFIPAIFGAVWLIGSLGVISTRRTIFRDVHHGKVEKVEGTAHLERRDDGEGYSYHLIVQGRLFGVSNEVYQAFTDGENYAVFYLPYSNKILSAEMLKRVPKTLLEQLSDRYMTS